MNNITVLQGDVLTRGITEDLYSRFIKYLDATPKTVETYTRALRQLFLYFSRHGIVQPRREDVMAFRDWLKDTGHKPTTVQNYITVTRLFFRWTEQEGLYPNVAEHVKGAKIDRAHKKDNLTSRQVKDVLEGMDTERLKGLRDYAILTLMVTGGLRTIEVIRADIGDFGTLGDDTVLYLQGKGRDEKTEYIKIRANTEKAIRAYLSARGAVEESEPLFASVANRNKGKRLTTRSVSRLAKYNLVEAGYSSERLTAHSFRHTAVTLSLLAGNSLEEVQQFARHENISTTMIYNHALEMSKNQCSETIEQAIF